MERQILFTFLQFMAYGCMRAQRGAGGGAANAARAQATRV